MSTIGAIEIQMMADLARLRQDMNEAKSVVGNAMQGIKNVVGGAMGGLLAGLSVAAFGSWIKGAVDAADASSKMAQKIGVATQDLAGIQLAFKQSGLEANDMQRAMTKLTAGIAGGEDVFKRMGITAKGSKEALYQIADVFSSMPDGLRKTALAAEVFGEKIGANMIPLLNGGSEGLKAMADQAEKLGLVISTDTGKAAEEFNDTLSLVGEASKGMATQVMAALLPTLKSLAGSFLDGVTSGGKMAKAAEIISAALKGLFSVAAIGVEVFNTLGKSLGAVAAAVMSVAQGEFKQAWKILEEGGRDIGKGWGETAKMIEDAWSGAGSATVDSANAMTKALNGTTVATKAEGKAAEDAAKAAAKAAAKQAEEIEKIRLASIKANDAYLAMLNTRLDGGEAELQSLRLQYIELTAGKEVKDALLIVEIERNIALLEYLNIMEDGREASAAERAANNVRIRQLKDEIALRKGIAQATADPKVSEANKVAADNAVSDWQRAADQIGQSLADALMRGGKSASEYLKGLFRSWLGSAINAGFIQPAIGSAAGALGVGGGGSGGLMGYYNAGSSIYNAGAGFSSIGNYAAGAYTYGNVASGAAYGTGFGSQQSLMLAQQEAGMGMSAGGTAGAVGTWAANAAGVAAGIYGGRAISGGYSTGGSGNANVNAGTAIGAVVGSIFPAIGTAIGAAVGGMIGGLVNRAFGHKDVQVMDSGVSGTFGGGGFTGQSFVDLQQKGGWFRSDKNWTDTSPLNAELEKFFDDAADSMIRQAKVYGDALGLPADMLSNATADIRIKLGEDAEANKTAILEALTGYGEALAASWTDALKPLAVYGETTIQTIERVATAILSINSVLDMIGVTALESSVAGGQAAVALADMFGGLDNLAQASAGYYAAYFSEAERAGKATEQITAALADVGIAMPDSREAFRAVVEGLDLTTEAGRQQFVVLMNVAGAFAELNPVIDETAAAAKAAEDALRDAAAVLKERESLERELLQLQGDTATIRERERAALDESNRALYDQIAALQDKQAADEMAAGIAQERAGLERELLQLQGDTAAIRELERNALDESNRALYDQIKALEDQAAAADKAAQAAQRLAAAESRMNSQVTPSSIASSAAAMLYLEKRASVAGDLRAGTYGNPQVQSAYTTDQQRYARVMDRTDLWVNSALILETADAQMKAIKDQNHQRLYSEQAGRRGMSGGSYDTDKQMDLLRQQAESTQDLIDSLDALRMGIGDFRNDLLGSALDPANPTQKYAAEKALAESLGAAAMTGDPASVQAYQEQAQAFLQMSQGFNASSQAYAVDFAAVLATLEAIDKRLEQQQATATATLKVQQRGLGDIVESSAATAKATTLQASTSRVLEQRAVE